MLIKTEAGTGGDHVIFV